MTEKEKMIACLPYDCNDEELVRLRSKAHKLCQKYNKIDITNVSKKQKIIKQLGVEGDGYFEGPIFFDYGCNIKVGKFFYANFNLTILDCAKVTIGDNVFIGPNVSIVTPMHSLDASERAMRIKGDYVYDVEYAKEIKIGNDVWIASNVVILPGVNIGNNVVIGAGSVVSKDIPDGVLAVGNPCQVKRLLNEKDKLGF